MYRLGSLAGMLGGGVLADMVGLRFCAVVFSLGTATLAGILQALRWGCEPWLAPLRGKLADARYGWQLLFLYAFGCGAVIFALLALPLPLPLWFACATAMALTTLARCECVRRGGGSFIAHGLCPADGHGCGLWPSAGIQPERSGINTVYAL
ncbi:hypothetical protein AGMMS49974_06530 [Deltaproteobacteria bacterium]|nr:hypothetical protein AGMMS49974_06530 [Deltaproteobacteria bacterium]